MTKTFTAVLPYRIAKLSVLKIMLLGTNSDRSLVWNLDHCDLFEIWFLVLGNYMTQPWPLQATC